MTDRSVGHDHVVPEDPLERGADPGQRVAGAFVADMGLELDPVGAEGLERVGQLEQLRLTIGARSLVGDPDPRPADLEAAMLGDDRQISAAADGATAGPVDRGERPFRACLPVGQRRLEPMFEPRLVLVAHDRPAPQGGIERDQPQVGQVLGAERLEPDPRPLEDDRFDPCLRRHHGDGSGAAVAGRRGRLGPTTRHPRHHATRASARRGP